MKRGIFLISFLLLMISPVYAKENRLYFTEENNRLYYESGLFDEKVFMKHTEMMPGDSYQDILKIENGTRTKYTLYMKSVPTEENENDLLDNIQMIIKLDGRVIYSGNATGEDFNDQGINLQNAVLLGDIKPNQTATMEVSTKLRENYGHNVEVSTGKIDWVFYASYGNSEPDIINPNTYSQSANYNMTLLWIVLGVITVLIVWFKVKEKSHRTKSKKLLQKS